MSAIKIIQALGRKIAAKKAKTPEGITQIQPQIYAESEASNIAQRLVDAGLPMERFDEFIFSEADLVRLLNQIKALEKKNLAENIRSGIRNTESAKVFDLKGKRIKDTDNIMGGEEMPPPGSRGGKDDIAAPVQSSEESLKNMIEAENKKNINKIKQRQKMLAEAIDNVSPSLTGDRKYDAEIVAADLAERMGLVYDDLPTKQRLKLYDEAYTGLTKKKFDPPEDLATGGRVGLKFGTGKRFLQKVFGKEKFEEMKTRDPEMYVGLLEVVDMYRKRDKEGLKMYLQKFLPHMDDAQIEDFIRGSDGTEGLIGELIRLGSGRDYAGKIEMIKRAEEMKKLRDLEVTDDMIRKPNADGGIMRLGFKDGMNRRTFLKLLGGAMSIPIIGKIFKPLKVGKTVTKVPIIKTDNVPGKPEWFDQLVNKVILEGDDVSKRFATKDREIVHMKVLDEGTGGKEFPPGTPGSDDISIMVTQDLDAGAVRVEYRNPENMYGDPVQLRYKKPNPDEGDPRPSAEFDTAESIPVARADGPDDYAIDIDEGGGQSIKDLTSDVSKLKEYATGQKQTLKEFIQSKKRKDKARAISQGEGEAEQDFIINRQGEEIVEYPEPDFDDAFASGGIARMLGE